MCPCTPRSTSARSLLVANKLDDVQSGLVPDLGEVITEYSDPASLLHDLALPVLARYSGRQLAQLLGTHRRTIDRIRQGQHPRSELSRALTEPAAAVAQRDLDFEGLLAPEDLQILHSCKNRPLAALLNVWRQANRASQTVKRGKRDKDLDKQP